MKKCCFICILLAASLLTGCSAKSKAEEVKGFPTLYFASVQNGQFVSETGPYVHMGDEPMIDTLPDGYVCVGSVSRANTSPTNTTEEEYLESGLDGRKIYTDGSHKPERIYVETADGYGLWKILIFH